jgi:hypothetical protein
MNAPGRGAFWERSPLPEPDVRRWRLWISTVGQPNNIKMEEKILENGQLIVGGTMPPAFEDFLSHTESYRGLIAGWEPLEKPLCGNGVLMDRCENLADFANMTQKNFPASFLKCVQDDFLKLKKRQEDLKSSLVVLFPKKIVRSPSCEVRESSRQTAR